MTGPPTVWVEVATELLAELGEWSEPVQVRVERIDPAGRCEMVFRRPPPPDEGWRLADEPKAVA